MFNKTCQKPSSSNAEGGRGSVRSARASAAAAVSAERESGPIFKPTSSASPSEPCLESGVGGTSSACRRKHEVDALILARLDERGQRRVDHVALVLLRVFVWRIFVRIFGVFSASLDTDEATRAF